ncbi:MAG: methyltransferase domain-containing protein [Bacteroidetes bacterium]|nr:MAG: methyltransferase domain-containing protein [Bacteroidota bacterium]
MGRNNYFQFKQFRIHQEKTAMKVNTDGVLLGAWTNVDGAITVLDIGAGTGLISLMIAQRSGANITGIEIENNASDEAVQNVKNSKWSDRVSIQHISFQDFAATTQHKFDLIVSNPPFFSNSVKNMNPHLSVARHNHLLPFEDIIEGTKKLLAKTGKLSLILPFDSANGFIEKARMENLFLNRLTGVKPFPDKKPNRCLMEFGSEKLILQKTQMSVFDETGKDYSGEFKLLARDFYLKL